jgi:copper(I)-binding protein
LSLGIVTRDYASRVPLGLLRRTLAVVVVALVGLLAGVTLASCGGEDASTTTETTAIQTTETTQTTETMQTVEQPTVVRITVEDGVPAGGIVRESVEQGDDVRLVVTSDVADEIHLHGYDLSRDVAAGGTAQIDFEATIPGRFEVELEERGVQIAELTVNP